MEAFKVEAVADLDGELRLTGLPFRKGDKVAAILWLPLQEEDALHWDARRRLLEHARQHEFRSQGPYPTREELHER